MNEIEPATPEVAPVASTERVRAWAVAPLDVVEVDGDLRLRLDVPGVRADDLDVRFEAGVLTVKGARADQPERGWHRTLRVPDAYDASALTATARHGVLTLVLPRAEAAKPRRIPVTAH